MASPTVYSVAIAATGINATAATIAKNPLPLHLLLWGLIVRTFTFSIPCITYMYQRMIASVNCMWYSETVDTFTQTGNYCCAKSSVSYIEPWYGKTQALNFTPLPIQLTAKVSTLRNYTGIILWVRLKIHARGGWFGLQLDFYLVNEFSLWCSVMYNVVVAANWCYGETHYRCTWIGPWTFHSFHLPNKIC